MAGWRRGWGLADLHVGRPVPRVLGGTEEVPVVRGGWLLLAFRATAA